MYYIKINLYCPQQYMLKTNSDFYTEHINYGIKDIENASEIGEQLKTKILQSKIFISEIQQDLTKLANNYKKEEIRKIKPRQVPRITNDKIKLDLYVKTEENLLKNDQSILNDIISRSVNKPLHKKCNFKKNNHSSNIILPIINNSKSEKNIFLTKLIKNKRIKSNNNNVETQTNSKYENTNDSQEEIKNNQLMTKPKREMIIKNEYYIRPESISSSNRIFNSVIDTCKAQEESNINIYKQFSNKLHNSRLYSPTKDKNKTWDDRKIDYEFLKSELKKDNVRPVYFYNLKIGEKIKVFSEDKKNVMFQGHYIAYCNDYLAFRCKDLLYHKFGEGLKDSFYDKRSNVPHFKSIDTKKKKQINHDRVKNILNKMERSKYVSFKNKIKKI